jgi:long-chain fatty acid transport protein
LSHRLCLRAPLKGALVAISATALLGLWAGDARAAGFELPENTTKSLARGGTGAAMKRDPSAIYFNPALLTRAKGYQLQLDVNLVDVSLDFQRDPLTYQSGAQQVRQEFAPVKNEAGVFPAPFLATSLQLSDDLTIGLGVFGPPAYGHSCYGTLKDNGDCDVVADGAARHMLVESNLLQIYMMLGVGYKMKVGGGVLSVGISGGPAYQRNSFKLVVDADVQVAPPWEEDPSNESTFTAQDLSGWNIAGILGVAWEKDGLHLGASYRPPLSWEVKGKVKATFPQQIIDLSDPALTSDGITLKTAQAGSLRVGAGWADGVHPGFADRPRLELEANLVWEDWSRVQNFEVATEGDLALFGGANTIPLQTIYQRKGWKDTYSMRLGGSWGALPWLTAHAGAYMETGAQANAVTNVDFVSWDRRAVSGGATIHISDLLDLDLGYAFISSPDRRVSQGQVYNAIPLSKCEGPDYDGANCANKGQPAGNPQNNGSWSTHAQIGSVGLTLHLD